MAKEAGLKISITPETASPAITVVITETEAQRVIGEGPSAHTEEAISTTTQRFPNPDQLISSYQTERFRGWLVTAGGVVSTYIGGTKIFEVLQYGRVTHVATDDRYGVLSAFIAVGAGIYILAKGGKIIQRVNTVRQKLEQAQREALTSKPH
jgi:hypothetical protein